MTALTPRSVFVDRMMLDVNGIHTSDPSRHGFLGADRAERTLDLFKASLSNPLSGDQFFDGNDEMAKSVTVSTGLTYYDLRPPALNLFPTLTPLRNSVPRNQRKNPGDALRYKVITATTGSGYNWTGFVPEGQRAGRMSYTLTNNTLSYVTIGEEDSLTEEAREAAQGFEDEDAMVQLRLMLKMMVKEEAAILAGNTSLALGTPGTPTLAAAGSTATLPGAPTTYSVIVVALSQLGYLQSTLAGGVATTQTVNGADGKTFSLNGGSSNKSSAATQAITLGQALNCSVAAVSGAVAYAWYVGTAGSEKLEAITTINSVSFSAPLLGTGQAATAITADCSRNNGLAFDGLLTTLFSAAAAGNAYLKVLPNGTAGIGTQLTSSGAGSVVEIDAMLKSMWDNYRISPTVIYVNSQELKSIAHLVLNGSSTPLLRYDGASDGTEYRLAAGGTISFYFNPYTPDGGIKIPIKIHPNLAPGTIIAWAEKLPAWYVSNETPLVAEMLTRKDYYTTQWPKVSRQQDYGVYAQEALAVYAPFAMGGITNIAPTA